MDENRLSAPAGSIETLYLCRSARWVGFGSAGGAEADVGFSQAGACGREGGDGDDGGEVLICGNATCQVPPVLGQVPAGSDCCFGAEAADDEPSSLGVKFAVGRVAHDETVLVMGVAVEFAAVVKAQS